MAIKNNLLGGVDNSNGEIIDATDVNDTNNAIITSGVYGNVPIGCVMSWLKSYTNTPTLPTGWVECNGQVLNDADSVYDTQTIPNLNGDNRFLRGNATSGTTGGAATTNITLAVTTGGTSVPKLATSTSSGLITTWTINNTGFPTNQGDKNNEPQYMNVVWIMRVK